MMLRGSYGAVGCRLCLMAAVVLPIAAEARDGAFMRCAFDNGRIVTLSHDDGDFEWQENDFRGSIIQPAQMSHDPVLTYFGPWADPERIDVFVGWTGAGGPAMQIGDAMLTRTIITDAGQLESEMAVGTCEDLNQ